MKCAELYRLLIKNGWYPISQKGSHVKMKHDTKPGLIIIPTMEVKKLVKDLRKRYAEMQD